MCEIHGSDVIITVRARIYKLSACNDSHFSYFKMRGIIQNRESADVAEKMIELWDEDIANMKEKAIDDSKQKQEYWKNQPHADESDDETESIQNAEQKPKKPIKKQSHRNKDTISHAASHRQTNGGHPYEESPYQPLRNNYYN